MLMVKLTLLFLGNSIGIAESITIKRHDILMRWQGRRYFLKINKKNYLEKKSKYGRCESVGVSAFPAYDIQ